MMTVPEELKTAQEQLEAIQNKMLVIDQNYDRIKRLHDGEREEIRVLQSFKADLTSQNESLTKEQEVLKSDIKKLNSEKEELLSETYKTRTTISDAKEAMAKETINHETVKAELIEKSRAFAEREASVIQRETDVRQREAELEIKHDSIKKFAEKL